MVYSWFRRRLRYEHRKLLVQNFKAAHDPEMKVLAGLHGEWAAFDGYESAKVSTKSILNQLIAGHQLESFEIDAALNLNREFRRLFDQIGRKDRGAFDIVYRPLGGWKYYFENNEDDAIILTNQDYVDAEVARLQNDMGTSRTFGEPS